MARWLDDPEFWLPSEFLTGDSVLGEGKTEANDDFCAGLGNTVGLKSDLGSPVDALMGLPVTETEEDEFIAYLNRKLALHTFRETKPSSDYKEYGWKLSGSPQSTLCGFKAGSSRESPKCVSGIASPLGGNDLSVWDLLHAASGEVARLRVNEKPAVVYPSKPMFPDVNPHPMVIPRNNASAFYPNRKAEAYYGFPPLQERQPLAKNGVWGSENPAGQFYFENPGENLRIATPNTRSCQRPTQLLPASSMRSAFLGENCKKERTGTGVFLPRRYEAISTETRKKSGCSVLLPDKVVHALNLNLHSINSSLCAQSRTSENYGAPSYASFKHGTSPIIAAQRRKFGPKSSMNQELRLPQEWTY